MSWQITPIALTKGVTDPDPAAAKRAFDAMLQMKRITSLQSRRRAAGEAIGSRTTLLEGPRCDGSTT